MAVNMEPQPGDYSINLPVTFDYRGGRASNKKGKILVALGDTVITILTCVIICLRNNFELWQKILFVAGVLYFGLFILRFLVFRELYYSDIFESMKKIKKPRHKNASGFFLRIDKIGLAISAV